MNKRVGVVGIVVEDLDSSTRVNEVLHDYAHIIIGRMGVPYKEREISVISLIVDGTSDEISAMTGKIGKISGVTVKSAITKK
ncbi:TM1266 family iron-only hydrogenase system putative regulator [Clostridium cochlearium]|jgi:putative iron-only hydrogenase system regulator|uniref:CopG family transcriptional regulator n=1 Tax=Clostridium cochlearium TaxID=1494 RepID=A0A239ZZM7_CLOCO|nr:TM1266 family iron-only hydrogenase system putative regulator [Clostridium cochlearium]MBV1819391.1 iron-only hydrogenase system regulator [Bacteroidales bacterium MSK.15.36]NSJ90614.1 CopG family transcriptional regulator [Coprococcus sp. MSK.21.13]MBE6064380.1 CopG family transcriptional regulator [Clostridium cochlearium]MBU5268826.1 iron-only hydrogenase system regulator [Clostridium cochlearium]MCG4570898.1 iron-only hydrogenase system regulator [Clostridium cochlearium]